MKKPEKLYPKKESIVQRLAREAQVDRIRGNPLLREQTATPPITDKEQEDEYQRIKKRHDVVQEDQP